MSILSQIIAYSPNKIDTEKKAKTLLLAEVPRSEMDNFNTPDLEQSPDSFLKPGETLEDFDVEFRRPNAQGGRIPFGDGLTVKQQQKVIEAFPDIEFNFKEYPKYGVKKYLTSKVGPVDDRKTNKDYTKIDRFKKKGFTLEMGKGKNTRGEEYSKEGKRLSIKDQNKIKATFELPEGVKEWDFSKPDQKYGFKPDTPEKKNIAARMAKKVGDKNPWTLAADFGSAKGWMLAQMERVYKNESKNPNIKKLTYKPIYEEINGQDRIIGFKDNTIAGQGKTYYGLDKYTKKNAGDWTKHGDYKQNLKLIDISKRSGNAPNEVIMGLLKDRDFKGNNVKLNDLIHFLSGTKETSQEILKNAIVRHHNSGVAFGSATNDLSLTTQTINKRIVEAEKRIRANNILPEDVQLLKNNNVYVRSGDGNLYGSGKKSAIGQFKQIESNVARSLESGVDFKGKKFETKQLLSYLEKLGCGKSAGGRIMFGEGTSCAIKGREVLEKGLKSGFKNADDAVLARGILKSGKFLKDAVSLRGLFGPAALAFTVAAEAGLVGYDMLSEGKSFKEAVGDSVFNYMLGDKTKINSDEEFIKRLKNIPGSPSQGFRGVTDEDIGKMQYFKSMMSDMQKGFQNYDDITNLKQKITDNETNKAIDPEFFSDQAFQLNTQLDKAQADNQDYFRTNKVGKLENYFTPKEDGTVPYLEGAEALKKATLMAKGDQLKNVNPSSPKGIERLNKKIIKNQYDLYKMNNPTKINKFGQMFMDATPGEQSYFMGRTDFMEGGIASLNVNKK